MSRNSEELDLSKYIAENALTRVRLNLLTKSDKKQCESLESDHELPLVFEVDRMVNQLDTRGGDAGVDISQSKLIGTSSDRENIRGQQENEYEESLAIDQSQEQERLKQEETLRKQLYLQEARKAQVPIEPSMNEQCAVFLVRHVVLGIEKRKLKTTEKISAVYLWWDMERPYSVVIIRFNPLLEWVYLDSTIGDEDRQGNFQTYAEKIGPCGIRHY